MSPNSSNITMQAQAERLNNKYFSNLYNNLVDATANLSAMQTMPDGLQNVSIEVDGNMTTIYDALNKTVRDISAAKTGILATQQKNLEYLNDYANFMLQNQINQDLTNLYAQSQANNTDQISKTLKQDAINKLRMTEINEYYIKKNQLINKIIKYTLVLLAILLINIILVKINILPSSVGYFFGTIIVLLIIAYIIYNAIDIRNRDKLNFDEYVIPFDEKAKAYEASGNFIDISTELKDEFRKGIQALETPLGCIGESCCAPGTVYDIDMKQCSVQCPSGEVMIQITDAMGNVTSECSGNTGPFNLSGNTESYSNIPGTGVLNF